HPSTPEAPEEHGGKAAGRTAGAGKDVGDGSAYGGLDDRGSGDGAAYRRQRGSRLVLGAHLPEPVRAVVGDLSDVGESLDVLHKRWTPAHALLEGAGRHEGGHGRAVVDP